MVLPAWRDRPMRHNAVRDQLSLMASRGGDGTSTFLHCKTYHITYKNTAVECSGFGVELLP
eukprot:4645078-Amphidinium_carterae.1